MNYIYDMDRITELMKASEHWRCQWWARLVRNYPNLGPKPIVKINKRLKVTAGQMLVESRTMELSFDLLDLYPDQFWGNIIPHELAHMAAYDVYGIGKGQGRTAWHGKEWASIMLRLELQPETYHNMQNTRWKKR